MDTGETMTRLDGPLWAPRTAGGIGPGGFLGSAAFDPPATYYAPLHDYHLDPPGIAPEVEARCHLIAGRDAILSQTTIAQHTDILTTLVARTVPPADWFAYVGVVTGSTLQEDIIMVHHPDHVDRRLAAFEYWWSSPDGLEDQELLEAIGFLSAHELATRGFLGVCTNTADPAVVQHYSIDQQVVISPWDRLVELGRTDMVAP